MTDLPADFEVALQGVDTRLKALQPGTTLGDIAYSSATANTNTRLGIGTSGQVLAVSGGGVPAWTTTADVTPLTTKGDLFTFTTVDARLGIGANNTVLTADSAEATGMKWATPAGGGKVLQVVYASVNSGATTSSTSLVDTQLTATITPTLNTSKILVIYSQNGCGKSSASAVARMTIALVRGATVLQYNTDITGFTNTTTSLNVGVGASGTYLDSPATTSATTYKTQFLSEGGNTVFCQDSYASTYKSASTITLMEIGA